MKTLKKRIPPIILLVYTTIIFLALFMKGNYILELVITLLPYWIILNLSIVTAITLKILLKRHTISFSFLFLASGISLGVVTLILFIRFFQFSYLPTAHGEGKEQVTIAFFNKLYSNTNYGMIETTLTRIHPDIVGISELRGDDIPNIDALSQYQCAMTKNARNDAVIALFSKLPCEIKTDIFRAEYILPVTLHMHGKEYHVFVIHPLPPGTPSWLKQRNTELALLGSHISSLQSDNVIVLGDFNTSPWSQSFRDFSNTTMLKNVAKGKGVAFTWNGGLIRTHVDHIYVPNNAHIQSFQSERVSGSDHQLIWTSLQI